LQIGATLKSEAIKDLVGGNIALEGDMSMKVGSSESWFARCVSKNNIRGVSVRSIFWMRKK